VSAAAVALLLGSSLSVARADEKTSGSGTAVTGVLIDQACGSKMVKKDDPEKAAAGHTKDCATKEACEKSGYAVIAGKRMLKFDANGNKLAKEYLEKTDKSDNIRVTVQGTEKGDEIAVTAITPAEEKK